MYRMVGGMWEGSDQSGNEKNTELEQWWKKFVRKETQKKHHKVRIYSSW